MSLDERICPRCACFMHYHSALPGWFKCDCGYHKKELKSMISMVELNPHNYPVTPEISANLNLLFDRINQIRILWGKPMVVTSGLRSDEDQARINPNAPKSKHLIGAACDILDEDGSLKAWVMDHVPDLERIGLWCEDFKSTPNWCHFQVLPPKSGHRFFIP